MARTRGGRIGGSTGAIYKGRGGKTPYLEAIKNQIIKSIKNNNKKIQGRINEGILTLEEGIASLEVEIDIIQQQKGVNKKYIDEIIRDENIKLVDKEERYDEDIDPDTAANYMVDERDTSPSKSIQRGAGKKPVNMSKLYEQRQEEIKRKKRKRKEREKLIRKHIAMKSPRQLLLTEHTRGRGRRGGVRGGGVRGGGIRRGGVRRGDVRRGVRRPIKHTRLKWHGMSNLIYAAKTDEEVKGILDKKKYFSPRLTEPELVAALASYRRLLNGLSKTDKLSAKWRDILKKINKVTLARGRKIYIRGINAESRGGFGNISVSKHSYPNRRKIQAITPRLNPETNYAQKLYKDGNRFFFIKHPDNKPMNKYRVYVENTTPAIIRIR